ncbi:MAG: DNA alkylation repair protein [Anaerolineales bacterium]|nr:DNA alkylation repair protein [Anaerolineales bacterium]MCK5633867.1 DNA alkylation repair protein [Anaerolineales bacterium]
MSNLGKQELTLPDQLEVNTVLGAVTRALEGPEQDSEYLQGMKMAVPGAGKLYGVRVPQLRTIAKQLAKKYRDQDQDLDRLAQASWAQGSREHRLIALFVLAGRRVLIPERRWELGVKFLPDVEDWETCDQLCHALLGQALAEDPNYMDQLETWIDDGNFWVRRAALVSTVILRRAKYSEGVAKRLDQRTLRMCAVLLNDGEKYIRKAVDWTVREVIKRNYKLAFTWMVDQAQKEVGAIGRSTLKLSAKKLEEADKRHLLAALG